MLKYIFNEKLTERIADKITQILDAKFAQLEMKITKELSAIRFDLKRLDEKIAKNQFKQTSEYGLLKYQIQNLEGQIRKKDRTHLEDQASH
jgi:hypothetical protein